MDKLTDEQRRCNSVYGHPNKDFGKVFPWVARNIVEGRDVSGGYDHTKGCAICSMPFLTLNSKTGKRDNLQPMYIHKIRNDECALVCMHCEKMSIRICVGKRPKEDYFDEDRGVYEYSDWDEDNEEAESMKFEDRFDTFNPDGYAELLLKRVVKSIKKNSSG